CCPEQVHIRGTRSVRRRLVRALGCSLVGAMLLTGCTSTEAPPSPRPSSTPPTTTSSRAPDPVPLPQGAPQSTAVIPAPVRVQRAPEENFPIDSATAIVPAKSPDAEHAADLLRDTLRRSTGFELPATDRG